MAIKLAKKNNVFNILQRTFYIDDESDLETIEAEYDCGIGDIAECPDGTIYRRHSDGYDGELWVKKGSSGGGGGGSGLPDVAAADDGKTMVVQKVKTKETLIVPEQTVTIDDIDTPVVLANTTLDAFVEGAEVIVVVNDIEYKSTVVTDTYGEGKMAQFGDGSLTGVIGTQEDGSPLLFMTDTTGDYTITASVPEYGSAGWVVAPQGMYIHITKEDDGEGRITLYADKTYSEIISAISRGVIPVATIPDQYDDSQYYVAYVESYHTSDSIYYVAIGNDIFQANAPDAQLIASGAS